jgi:Zn-dependent protease
VSTTSPDLIRNCRRCSRELAPGALACEACHALVHSEQLDRLAAEAKALEESDDPRQARERWLTALQLLPASSTQAQWITDHARSLETAAGTSQFSAVEPGASPPNRTQGLRGMFSLSALLSFAAFVVIYSKAAGAQFGIGFAVLILIHEMGHYVDIRRRGLPADMPVFLPGLGAYVRWRALGVSLETRAAVSLAGPLAGFLAAVACALIWSQTHDPFWLVLARLGAAMNLLNLIPVWILDGGQAALALSKSERIVLLVVSMALWLMLRENMLLIVAAGTAYRAFFAVDFPAYPSRITTAYFALEIATLGALLRILPGHGFGVQ